MEASKNGLDRIVNAVDNIMDSLSSFSYGAVIKIMGRHCPDLLNSTAKALHTEYLVTDAHINIDTLAKTIKKNRENNS